MVDLLFFLCFCFFFNDTATTEIYTLSLHDALPISTRRCPRSICRSSCRTTRSVLLGRQHLQHHHLPPPPPPPGPVQRRAFRPPWPCPMTMVRRIPRRCRRRSRC